MLHDHVDDSKVEGNQPACWGTPLVVATMLLNEGNLPADTILIFCDIAALNETIPLALHLLQPAGISRTTLALQLLEVLMTPPADRYHGAMVAGHSSLIATLPFQYRTLVLC